MSEPAAEQKVELHRGLLGVYFDRTRSSFIDGRAGRLLYRGYSIDDLAQHSTFEETAYLLLHGELPTATELHSFDQQLRASRAIPDAVIRIICEIKNAHPMDVLRTAVSALSAFDVETDDKSVEATLRKGMRLTAQLPTIVAAHHAIRCGEDPLSPDLSLSHAANFLYMVKRQPPSERAARLMDKDFVLHGEHGANASAFAARVVTSTDTDLHAAICGAIGALKGPAHGGAAENVMKMAEEIGEPERAADYVKRLRAMRKPVMGFGHRVYRTEDPRARHLREDVKALSIEMGEPRWYAILEAAVQAMKPYARHGVNVNVDFYAGVIYYLNGIPQDMFIPVFAIGRLPGWTLHVMEQLEQNILLRPLLLYDGETDRTYVPLDQR